MRNVGDGEGAHASGRSFIGPAKVIALCTLVSRVLGMARDILCALIFGAGMVWDAFAIAFIVPNLFRRIFGEGALTAAFVPTFVDRMEKEGETPAYRHLNVVFTLLAMILGLLVVIGVGVTLILPSFIADAKLRLVCELLTIMFPYMFFICLAAILGAALNSMRHFIAPAAAPIILNVVWIAGLLVFVPLFGMTKEQQIFAIAWVILVGGLLEFGAQLPPLYRRGVRLRAIVDPKAKGVREVLALFVPVVFGLSLVQINELVDNLIAELCVPGDGAVSALYYGNRVMQLPLAVIGTALATAVFPLLTSKIAAEKGDEFAGLFQRSVRVCLFVAVPASVGLIVLGEPVIRLLFERGKFTVDDTVRVTSVLTFYAMGIWAYSCNQILVRAFYAQKDMKTPVKVSAAMVGLNLILNLVLVWPLREAGLALATAISGFCQTATLMTVLRRRFAVDVRGIAATFLRSAILSLIMGVVCGAIAYLLVPMGDFGSPTVATAVAVIGAMIGGIVVYFLGARFLRMRELSEWRR